MTSIDLDTLAQAIGAQADSEELPSGTMASKIGRVGEHALNELLRRLENPTEAGELASTGLLNLANAWMKIEEKRLEVEANTDTGAEVSELDLILSQQLPRDRKIVLLEAAHERLLARAADTQAVIQELKGPKI